METPPDEPPGTRRQAASDSVSVARDGSRQGGPIDPGALLADVQRRWRPIVTERGRELVLIVDAGLPSVSANGAAVRRILAVLIDNAVRHGRGRVFLTARDAGGVVAIDVADEGAGHAVAEAWSRRGPSGGGLAHASSLAEAERGRLALTRETPPWFTLFLPASSDGCVGPDDHPDPGGLRRDGSDHG